MKQTISPTCKRVPSTRLSAQLFTMMMVAVVTACSDSEPTERPTHAASDSNPLVVIGIDGATWDVINPMIEAGELPNFKKLRDDGAWGALTTIGPMVSPVVWTTFVTGRFPRDHGILDFTYPYQPGPSRPVQSNQRQVPAIWNVASEAQQKVSVVGYFGSFPAESINGVLISDRAKQDIDGSMTPEDALDGAKQELQALDDADVRNQLWERYLKWDYKPVKKRDVDPENPYFLANKIVDARLDHQIISDEYVARASEFLLGQQSWDVFISYFRLVDHASHALWRYYDDSDWDESTDPLLKEVFADVIPETYRYSDEVLGRLLAKAPENANILVISDHGFGSATGPYRVAPKMKKLLTGNHRRDGLFLAHGPAFQKGRVRDINTLEVMPLMLALSNLPLSDQLPGDVPTKVLNSETLDQLNIKTVPGYSSHVTVEVEVDSEAQQEEMKNLQGLGYIGEYEVAENTGTGDYDFWTASDHLIAAHLGGELSYYIVREDRYSLEQLVAEIQSRRPDLMRRISAVVAGFGSALDNHFDPEEYPDGLFAEMTEGLQP